MRKFLFICCMLLPSLLWAAVWNPTPTKQLVNDYSGMLSPSQRQELEQRLVAFNDSTSNQILIIITPTLGGDEIMAAGTRIATVWGVGQEKYDNGVLILIKSKSDDEPYGDVAILPGYGLEGGLPDAFCKRIIDDKMIEPLGDGDYYKALCEALDVIEPVCCGEYSYENYKDEDRAATFVLCGFFILILVLIVLAGRWDDKHNDGNGPSDDNTHNRRGPIFWGSPLGGYGGSTGGFGSGGFGGGFGGFGGGSFGGGGAHGRF